MSGDSGWRIDSLADRRDRRDRDRRLHRELALPPFVEGGVLRPHRSARRTVVINGGAFVLPFIHDITPVNMNVLPMEIVRGQARRADHPRPHAHRHRGRLLRPRAADPRGGRHRRRDARPAHAGARAAARAALRQVRLGASARSPSEMTMEEMHEQRGEYVTRRQGRRRRGARPERARAGIGRHHRSRPDRPRISSIRRTGSTPKA